MSTPEEIAAEQFAAHAAAAAVAPVDAGPTIEQIQQAQREAVLPYETAVQDLITQNAAMQEQLKAALAGIASAQQAAGPPAVELYAGGVAALVKAHANANPDLDPAYFAGAIKASNELKAAATEAVTSRDTATVKELAAEVHTWVKTFRGKHLDFSALLADLELLGEAAAKLAA